MEEDDQIYYEVSEAQYKSIVANRLARDDFVEDDGIGGYVDTGVDDFEQAEESEQSEDERPKNKCTCQMFCAIVPHAPIHDM